MTFQCNCFKTANRFLWDSVQNQWPNIKATLLFDCPIAQFSKMIITYRLTHILRWGEKMFSNLPLLRIRIPNGLNGFYLDYLLLSSQSFSRFRFHNNPLTPYLTFCFFKENRAWQGKDGEIPKTVHCYKWLLMRAHFTFSDPTVYVYAFYAFKVDLQSFFALNFPLGFKNILPFDLLLIFCWCLRAFCIVDTHLSHG